MTGSSKRRESEDKFNKKSSVTSAKDKFRLAKRMIDFTKSFNIHKEIESMGSIIEDEDFKTKKKKKAEQSITYFRPMQ